MIRKTIVAVLTLGALSSAVLWAVGAAGVQIPRHPKYGSVSVAEDVILSYLESPFLLRNGNLYIGGCYELKLRPGDPTPTLGPRATYVSFYGLHFYHDTAMERIGFNDRVLAGPPPPTVLTRPIGTWDLCVPLWPMFVLSACYPTFVLVCWSIHRRRRSGRGLCMSCRYDLTGNVSGVCPECGRAIINPTSPNRPSGE